ncbi:MAG: hypothetical protein CVT95_09130, partial [Bacteroidetes bacterium HGW-Bacteroidetes-12]
MKELIIIFNLLILVFLYSCSSFYYGQKQNSTFQTLYVINGTGKDLKWYTKNYLSNSPENNDFGYTWFIEGARNTISYKPNLDSTLFIGINYDN